MTTLVAILVWCRSRVWLDTSETCVVAHLFGKTQMAKVGFHLCIFPNARTSILDDASQLGFGVFRSENARMIFRIGYRTVLEEIVEVDDVLNKVLNRHALRFLHVEEPLLDVN